MVIRVNALSISYKKKFGSTRQKFTFCSCFSKKKNERPFKAVIKHMIMYCFFKKKLFIIVHILTCFIVSKGAYHCSISLHASNVNLKNLF